MIGDPLIISDSDYKKSENILKKLNGFKIILVGGGSGTKKSEQAYCLQNKLFQKNKQSLVISLDDYYNVMPSIRAINRKKMGIDCVGVCEINWESLKRIYEDFNNQRPIHFKRTHKFLDEIEHNTIDSEGIDYLLIEGLYANYLRKYYTDNLSVFLEGSPAQTLEFRQMRGKENEDDKFRQDVVQKEFNVVSQLKRYTDLVIPYEKN